MSALARHAAGFSHALHVIAAPELWRILLTLISGVTTLLGLMLLYDTFGSEIISSKKYLGRWIDEQDCWVLEHVFRLLKSMADTELGSEISRLLPQPAPYLLRDLDLSVTGWKELSREQFLTHIEKRQRARRSPVAGPPIC